MSLIPYFFDQIDNFDHLLMDPYRYTRPSFDHHFGLGIHPRYLAPVTSNPSLLRHNLAELQKGAKAAVEMVGPDGFQVAMDVQQFKPNEITVKAVENVVIVEAKHEERQDDHGYITRQFKRRYVLPKEVDTHHLQSNLSSDGILTLTAPKLALKEKGERLIQVQQTGPARLSIKATEEKSKNGK